MPRSSHSEISNRLLLALPASTLLRLQPALESVELPRGQVLSRVDRLVEHLYFVDRGLISLVKTMEDGRTIEISAIGREGITDVSAILGVDMAVLETVVQVPGTARRIRTDALRAALAADSTLRDVMQRYFRFCLHQVAQTAACNRLHSLEERCCRWLLIAHDSALADTFPLTHEFLAMMLGVHRAGVTIAARALKHAGLIRYTHGLVTVADRAGLEDAACECYRSIEGELHRLCEPPIA